MVKEENEVFLNRFFGLVALLLIVLRFLHFQPQLDLPHDWRQADTFFYIWDFTENGIDIMHPQVAWMGSHGELVLECPLPEAIVAQLQRWLGPSMLLSRSAFFLFFLFSAYYFYRVTEWLFSIAIAQYATLIFLALPLSQFYSRAIHIDFFVLGFAYAMFYYAMKAVARSSLLLLLLSSLLAIPAFLVKVPYIFYLALPILIYTWQQKKLTWLITRSIVFVLPLVCFLLWREYAYLVNDAAPDWSYILHYRKFTDNASWYFGVWQQRLSLYHWKVISIRMLLEVGGAIAIPLAFTGWWAKRTDKQMPILYAWGIGLLIYLLIFFNLNAIHNYYQIPFLGFVAILAGLGIDRISSIKKGWGLTVLIALVVCSTCYAEYNYYDRPKAIEEISQLVKSNTSTSDFPIVVYQDFDCRNPRILARAQRMGWSLESKAAKAEVIERLREEEGASHLFCVDPRIANDSKTQFPLTVIKLDSILLKTSNDYLYQLELQPNQ
jgi:hypothetical protein